MLTNEAPERATSHRGAVLLALGAALGIGLAAAGLMQPGARGDPALPADAVARINGEVIRRADYERVLAGLASDRRNGIDDAQRRLVLDRLVDEELLIQRGLELGFARRDQKVRADLTAAVIATVVTEHEDAAPTDDELQRFYDAQRDFFIRPGRLRVRQVFCHVGSANDEPGARQRAADASQRLRGGESFGAVVSALGDAEVSPLPDALLPPAKLTDYVGPTVLQAALNLGVGEVSDPVRSTGGYHVLQVVERQADDAQPFAEVRSAVLAEYRRRAGERALRKYLDDLRARADVTVASPTR